MEGGFLSSCSCIFSFDLNWGSTGGRSLCYYWSGFNCGLFCVIFNDVGDFKDCLVIAGGILKVSGWSGAPV